jgi:S1-C subfamily serine protease
MSEFNSYEPFESLDPPSVDPALSVPLPIADTIITDTESLLAYRAIIYFYVDRVVIDLAHPWKTGNPGASTGTGFYIGNKRIITNCHVVSNSTSIRLKRSGSPGTFQGKVVCRSEMCDLAVVTVENDSFWEGLPQVEFEEAIPNLGDAILAIGYPLRSKSISVTRGIVSGVSMSDLSLTKRNPRLMRVQIDAAINPGNSGGPVLNIETKKVVGVAFSSLSGAQCMCFIIPVQVLRMFLSAFEFDSRVNFGLLPEIGFICNELTNVSLRKRYANTCMCK